MTRKLEDLFDLPETPPDDNKESPECTDNPMQEMQEIIKKNGVNSAKNFDDRMDIELDDIAIKANNTYNDLISLGANVDSRYSARIFEVASIYLKISLDAKSTKINKVLKSSELQYKQNKLSGNDSSKSVVGSDHIITDRNSLLEKIKNIK